MHVPLLHLSSLVHESPSLQFVPAVTGTLTQMYCVEPVLWHWPMLQGSFAAEQSTALPAVH